jgi:predicted RNase H-like nuclease (RuvC/YqgF family)
VADEGYANAEIERIKTENEHIRADIVDLKADVKDLGKELNKMNESHIETKIFIRQIQESQSDMAKSTKENQDQMMKGIQDIRDEPIKNFKYYKMVGWAFAVTYFLGCLFSYIHMFTGK